MANLNSSGPLGNVMSRLGGLKSVSGRRVMPGAEFLQNLEDADTDVSGTAAPLPNFSNFVSPTQNQPEADLGGELTPQSYDVRANAVNSPSQQEPAEEPGMFSKLGQALADYINPQKREEMSQYNQSLFNRSQAQPQTPPVATAQVDEQEGLPPVTASEQEYRGANEPQTSEGFFGAIKDYFSPTKRAEMSQYNRDVNQDAQILSQGQNPLEVRNQKHEGLNADIQKAVENPWQYSAYGSAQEVANSPVLQAKFQEVTGMDFEPLVQQEVTKHEEAMKGVEDSLNGINTQLDQQAEGIKQRILNNQTTDADKYYIGLALLMPLILGGVFGKEAGLGALAGGAKGIADVLGGRQKSIREDEASLQDLNKQKSGNLEKLANLGLEKAKLPMQIRKNLPEPANSHLLGMEKIEFTDPTTGRPTEAYEILPGFVAKSQYVNTEKGRERMEKAASELSDTKSYVEQINNLTEDISGILTQLKDKPWWQKAHISSLSSIVPGSLSALTDKVKWKGQEVPAGPLLENQLGILANQYAHAQDLGQLDRAAQSHMEKIAGNPTKTLLTPKDVEAQIFNVRKFVQDELVKRTKNKGFYPEFVIRDMEAVNNPLFQGLNQAEDRKYSAQLKKQAMQGDTNYAQ